MPAPKEIFVNYRTGDEEMAAALIQRELSHRFGADHVFYASNSIRAGRDYQKDLDDAIRRSRILLAIIGPQWIEFPSGDGGRALDHENDWTRREIAQARGYGIPVIPVLIGRRMNRLKEAELPEALRFLASAQYVRFEHRSTSDLDHLVDEVLHHLPELAGKQPDAMPAQETPATRPSQQQNTVEHNSGTAHQMRDISGSLHTGRADNSGTIINQPTGSVHTGSGMQFAGSVHGTHQHFTSGDGNNQAAQPAPQDNEEDAAR